VNIFAFDPDPWVCALWLDDVRKNKMILETAQLLSSAAFLLNPTVKAPIYKPTHTGHPCTRWTMLSKQNYTWLVKYMSCLAKQKTGGHKSADLIPTLSSLVYDLDFHLDKQTKFANCARNLDKGLDFTHIKDVHEAYRLYIVERWKENTIPLSWVWGEKPSWSN